MNVLIVASGNSNDISPFVKEQVDSLINLDVKIQYFLIKGNGSIGYLQNIVKLRNGFIWSISNISKTRPSNNYFSRKRYKFE